MGGTPNLGAVQSTHNPKDTDSLMSDFVFCVNLSHTTLCRLLFVISVYFTLYVVVVCVFSYQSIMWFGLYKVIGQTVVIANDIDLDTFLIIEKDALVIIY